MFQFSGEGAKTEEMETQLHSDGVTKPCEESNCVAIKISGGRCVWVFLHCELD